MELPRRKPNRLMGYDYAACGAYFITICTKDRWQWFWNVGARIARPHVPQYELSEYGVIVDRAIQNIPIHYSMLSVDKYVIMPDHLHMILTIQEYPSSSPTISTVINQMKGFVTKQIGFSIWQKLFYDHIIRNEKEYQMIWEYIDSNPIQWLENGVE